MPTHLALMDVSPNKRGSFETYTVKLAAALRARGWNSVLAFWAPPPAWLRDELEQIGATVCAISEEPEFGGVGDWPAGWGRDRRFARVAMRWARRYRADIVHLHFCLVYTLLPFALRAAGVRRVVFSEHISLPFAERSRLLEAAAWFRNRLCMLAIDRALPVSDHVRRRLVESDHLPLHKTETLYNGIDLDRFTLTGALERGTVRDRLGVPPAQRLVVSVGQLIAYKGMHVLVDAVGLLASGDDVTLCIVGDGEERDRLTEQVRRLGLERRVRLLGRRDDVAAILCAADLFVCPSIWDEALGYVILEAMAAGLPVVASRAGGIPEVVRDGETGLLVVRNDAGELARAIDALLAAPERRQAMGRRGRRRVEEVFSLERSITRTMELYRELLNGS